MRGLSKTVVAAFGRKPHSPFLKSGGLPTAATILIFVIRAYRLTISPAQTLLFGPTGGCRFTPSCSVYARAAIQTHGAVAGTILSARRICRCHPWGGCGHDPVPKKNFRFQVSNSRF